MTPYTGVTSLVGNKVCLGPVKRTTCTDFVAKSTTTLYFLQQPFGNCNIVICCKTGLYVSRGHSFNNLPLCIGIVEKTFLEPERRLTNRILLC